MLDEYRQRFRSFHTHWQREQYLFLAGRKAQADTDYLYRENSDLFTPEALAGLRASYEETTAYRETERAALHRLITFASTGQLALQTQELEQELAAHEARAVVAWGEQQLTIRQASKVLAQESDPQRRRELYARSADAVNDAQDLRAERLAKWQAGAQVLGYEHLLQMRQTLDQVDLTALAQQAAQFLTKTESQFVATFKPLLAREAQISLDEATPADLGYLQSLPRFTPFFSGEQWREVYADLFAGLGFKVEQQSNVALDAAARPGKQERAFCAPLQVPEEIKLVINPHVAANGGYTFYQNFLQTAGQTQLFAWTSREGHYEFRVPGDAALAEAWGTLCRQLLHEAAYLLGTFGFPESGEFRHALAVFRLLHTRRAAALLQYETELYAGKLAHQAGARFTELLTDATQVRYDETDHLRAVEEMFQSAALLRAWAFEAQLREHLKTRFGARWWASRKAGEMLIDLWNTGHRYSVEELAALVGLGALDFAWLGNELLETLAS